MGATGEASHRVLDHGFHPNWTQDGKSLVYSTERFLDPYNRFSSSELWITDLESGKTRKIISGDAIQPAVSPHNKRIAYWSNSSGQRDIWTIGLDGTHPVQVTQDEALDYDPVWSPDGDVLFFLSDRNGSMNVWQVAIDEESGRTRGEARPVTNGSNTIGDLTGSASGLLAYAVMSETHRLRELELDPESGSCKSEASTVFESSKPMRDLDLSPNGDLIAFWLAPPADAIAVARHDGSGRRVLVEGHRNRLPAFSPDGQKIAFYANRTGRWEIWIVRPDGTGLEQASRSETAEGLSFPAWSPDGEKIAACDPSSGAVILELDKAGHQRSLHHLEGTKEGESVFCPRTWSPDGARMAGQMLTQGAPGALAFYKLDDATLEIIPGHADGSVRWLDNKRFLSSRGSKVLLYEIGGDEPKNVLDQPSQTVQVTGLGLSPDRQKLYFLGARQEADLWLLKPAPR
jgi:WD40 repeat protein